jgi:cbb3-type cytochrome oxidase subunit 3
MVEEAHKRQQQLLDRDEEKMAQLRLKDAEERKVREMVI